MTSLREHQKVKRTSKIRIKENDVVLIYDDGPRNAWKMGSVQEVIVGRDDRIRAAKVKTSNGELYRSINHLYPIEVSQRQEEQKAQTPTESLQDKGQVQIKEKKNYGIASSSTLISILAILLCLFGFVNSQLQAYECASPLVTERFSMNNIEECDYAKSRPDLNLLGMRSLTVLQKVSVQSRRFVQCRIVYTCLLYTSPSPRDRQKSRMPSSA